MFFAFLTANTAVDFGTTSLLYSEGEILTSTLEEL